jgi:hypothetical protein
MTSPFAQPPSRSRSQTSRSSGTGLLMGWMLLGLLTTTPTMAEPQPSIDIRWQAPPGCPQESDVRDRIQTLLGAGRRDSQLRAEGTITRIDRRFRLDLVVRVRDLVGTRSIESNSCEDLAGAAAVELGLLIHSAEAALAPSRPGTQPPTLPPVRGSEPSSSRSDGTDAQPAQGTSDVSPAERASNGAKSESKTEVESEAREQPTQVEARRAWHALVQAPVLELGLGPLPRPARGIGLSLGFEYANWQLQLQAISWQRQSVPAPGFPGYGADVDRIGATFWGCREFRSSWFGLSPCLTVGIERVSVRGNGRNIASSTQHAIGMIAGAGAQGRLHLASWIRLLMAVGGQIQLYRPQISIGGEEPEYQFAVYQFAPAAVSFAVGLEWIL